jgi:hypothetical protein
MIDILPQLVLSIGRHRFVKVLSLHTLDRRRDLGATKSQSGGASQGGTGDGQLFLAAECGLERFEVISWLPFLSHRPNLHHCGV